VMSECCEAFVADLRRQLASVLDRNLDRTSGKLLSNVFLCGTFLPGLAKRLESEFKKIKVCNSQESPENLRLYAWKGAALTASLMQMDAIYISKTQYQTMKGKLMERWFFLDPVPSPSNPSIYIVKDCHVTKCQCGAVICQDDAKDHSNVCPLHKVCACCSSIFQSNSALLQHFLNCPGNQISCPYSMDGCSAELPRSQIEKHLDQAHSHVKTLQQVVLVGSNPFKSDETHQEQEPEQQDEEQFDDDEEIQWCTVTTKVVHY